jgi:hypothetical protein
VRFTLLLEHNINVSVFFVGVAAVGVAALTLRRCNTIVAVTFIAATLQ